MAENGDRDYWVVRMRPGGLEFPFAAKEMVDHYEGLGWEVREPHKRSPEPWEARYLEHLRRMPPEFKNRG